MQSRPRAICRKENIQRSWHAVHSGFFGDPYFIRCARLCSGAKADRCKVLLLYACNRYRHLVEFCILPCFFKAEIKPVTFKICTAVIIFGRMNKWHRYLGGGLFVV